jgi:hypothetical protein
MVRAKVVALMCVLGVVPWASAPAGAAGGPPDGRQCFDLVVPTKGDSKPIALPPGVCFVEMEGGTDLARGKGFVVFLDRDGSARTRQLSESRYWLMPGPVWNDGSSVGVLRVPELPPGLRFTGVRAGASVVVYLVSDGTVVGRDEDGDLAVPGLPLGLSYVDGDASWYGFLVLLRSDGVVLIVDQGSARTGGSNATREVTAGEGRTFQRMVVRDEYVMLLDSEGRPSVQWLTPRLELQGKPNLVDTSRLDPSERFTDIATDGEGTFFLRQDGSVLELAGDTRAGSRVVEANPGVRFVEFLDRETGVAGLTSDGNAVGLQDDSGFCGPDAEIDCERVVPGLAKGYRWVAAAWTSHAGLYGAVRIPAGERVASSIGQVLTVSPHDPDFWLYGDRLSKQKKGWLWVEVSSRGQTKGGLVVVKRGSKVVGKARMGSGDVVKVALRMGSLKVGKNSLTVRFRGKGAVTPSAARTVKVTVRG